MNSSIEIDKTKYFLGYHYDVGEVLALNMAPQPGMFFINGETNSVWVWDALCRAWIDTNRVDSGLKGMLTDEAGNSPVDFIPSPQVGVKESYFYVAKTDTPQEVVFTHFKNGNNSVSVNVSKTSVVILYWNGSYWETSLIPMNINLSEYAKDVDLKNEIERSSKEDEIIKTIMDGGQSSFSTTFEATYEGKSLPFVIPKGATIYLDGDITEILGYSDKSDSVYAIIKSGDIADRDITYIKNRSELGTLNLSLYIKGLESRVKLLEKTGKQIAEIQEELYGGIVSVNIEITDYPAYENGSESKAGYFKGYKVDLTPYIGKYDEVYFRGGEFGTSVPRLTRGLILDNNGNVESFVPFRAFASNGWEILPITEKSKTLWASYCTKPEGGEVWSPEYVMFRNIGREGLLDKVERFDNRVEVVLPSDIYLVQGKTSQLFFRGFIKAVNPYDYDIKVMCNVGKTFPRYYEIDSNVPVGDYPLTIQVRDNNLKTLGEVSTTLHIIEKATANISKNILCIGASGTATGCWTAELKRLLNNNNLSFVGRKKGSVEDVNLEATGGWSWGNFVRTGTPAIRFYVTNVNTTGTFRNGSKLTFEGNTYTILEINITNGSGNIRCSGATEITDPVDPSSSSGVMAVSQGGGGTVEFTSWERENYVPFPNGDFTEYADKYCNGKIDVLIAHLGVNSSLWENSNPNTAISDARTLIDGYFADFPEGKMIITAIPMPDEGTNVYGNTNSENNINRYGTVSSFLRYNKALYDLAEELKSKYNISYVPTNVLFDTDYAYPKEYKSVNPRMDMFKEMVGVNGVHPIPEGSYMVSDAILPVFYKKIVE